MKHLLLLFCGGSISMHKLKSGTLQTRYNADQLLALEPRLKKVAKITATFIENIDSTNLDKRQWEKMVNVIAQHYDHYDGFLITHGTNTLGYTASALSFALGDIGKPVVLTGAQIPAEALVSDARNNLVNAVRVASMDLGGVFVVFGSKIILGCRAKKVNESELEAFKTFNASDFGEISISIKLNSAAHRAHRKPLLIKNGFDDNIISVTLVPGLKSAYLQTLLDKGVKGIVLRAFGSGDVPEELLPTLRSAKQKKVPVVVTTQCPGGATVMGLNEPGLQALKTGVIQAFDMSMEAMTTKLMWLLAQKTPYARMKTMLHKNFVGEINSNLNAVYFTESK